MCWVPVANSKSPNFTGGFPETSENPPPYAPGTHIHPYSYFGLGKESWSYFMPHAFWDQFYWSYLLIEISIISERKGGVDIYEVNNNESVHNVFFDYVNTLFSLLLSQTIVSKVILIIIHAFCWLFIECVWVDENQIKWPPTNNLTIFFPRELTDWC